MEDKYTVKEIKQKWISEFCSLLTEEEQKRCHMNQFMWHAFSYKMVEPILKGRLATVSYTHLKVWIYNGEVLPTKNNAKKEGSDK